MVCAFSPRYMLGYLNDRPKVPYAYAMSLRKGWRVAVLLWNLDPLLMNRRNGFNISLSIRANTNAYQVSYYGLPAAGMNCLSLLTNKLSTRTARVFRDLNLLVAEVEKGALVHPEDPDYPLLSKATQTIDVILNRVLSDSAAPHEVNAANSGDILSSPTGGVEWMPWANQDFWDFETDFWLNLSEHPMLAETDHDLQNIL